MYLRAISYFRPDWRLISVLLALIALSTGLGLLQAWPMAILIDAVLSPTPKTDFIHRLFLTPLPTSRLGQVIGITLIGMGMKIVQDALTGIRTLLNNKINYNGLLRVRCELYQKLQHLNLAYHKSQPQGDAIFRLSIDAWGPKDILNVLITTVVAAVTLIWMTGIMLSRSVPLTIFALSVAPLLAITNVHFGRTIRERTLDSKARDTEFTTAAQRSMACVWLVQAFGRQVREFTHFRGTVRECTRAWMRQSYQEEAYWFIIRTIFSLGGAIIFGYGGYLVWRDQFAHPVSNGVTCGDLMVFMGYLGMLWDPLCKLTGFAANIQGGLASAQRLFEVLDRDLGIADAPDAIDLPPRPRTLSMDGVGFSYNQGKPVLSAVSVKIEPGKMVAFIGASGAGKSTLLSLLPRFYDPLEGSIRLDGHDLRGVKLADVRKHIAIVPQDSLLLPASVRENITYGSPGATDLQIRRAAELAGAAAFIEAMPDGYDTEIAEGGQNLSGGQRQRLAIARALLTEAPVIVLDEPTSSLDPHHEQLISETLLKLKGPRTIVLVTHRMESVACCDELFVMHSGHIAERGSPASLLARGGLYAQMLRRATTTTTDDVPALAA